MMPLVSCDHNSTLIRTIIRFIKLHFVLVLYWCSRRNVGVERVYAGLASFHPTERSDGLCATLVLSPYQSSYDCQEFVAQTNDGFLLGIQRMWSLNLAAGQFYTGNSSASKQPVLLFHGILMGGDIWVLNPPDEALAFILADAGYDVWIANYRTTTFSYGHATFQRFDEGFWDWSVDELASEDLPASLELVHTVTSQKPHLVSFSQGCQATLAAFSEGVGFELVNKVALLAPVSYLTSGPQLVEVASKFQFQKVYEVLHIYELSTRIPGGREIVDLLCAAASVRCYDDWFRVFSGYVCCINSTRRPFIDKYETQATSVKNLDHFSQQVRFKTFAKYDYGSAERNVERYGQASPPAYDMARYPVSHRTLLVASDKDSLANVADVASLLSALPPGFLLKRITSDFGHADFVFGYNANRMVYDAVLQFLS